MDQTATAANESAEQTEQDRARRAVVGALADMAKVSLPLLLVAVVLLFFLGAFSWESRPVGVEPYVSTDTEIAVHANGCGEIRFNVKEGGDEIRVSAEHQTNVVAAGCQFYTTEVFELDEPVGSRVVVSADTGEALACLGLGCARLER